MADHPINRGIVGVGSLPSWTTVGFTGHRRLSDPDRVAEAVGRAVDRLSVLRPRLAAVSSVASGGDTIFLREMDRREFRFSVILPFPPDRFRLDFKDDEAGWNAADELMSRAVDVEIAGDRSAGAGTDGDAYMDAGYRTVDRADVVVAVWDGRPGKGFGGTADAVAYARAIGRPLLIINPDTGHTLEERMECLPAAVDVLPGVDAAAADPRGAVRAHREAVDAIASRHGPRVRVLVAVCLQLYLTASALGLAKLVFSPTESIQWILTGASAVILAVAAGLMYLSARSHDRWVRHRVEAEVCGSFLATWDIRRHATATHQPRPAIPGMRKLFADLRFLRQLDRSPLVGMDEAKSVYNTGRVEDQIRYFDRRLRRARRQLFWCRGTMKTFAAVAVVLEAAVLWRAVKSVPEDGVGRWMEFLGLTLPLVTTALGVLLVTLEVARRTSRYGEMLDELRSIQKRLLACFTWDALARVATEAEEELLQELVEWRSFVRFTRDVAHPG